jgi:hypothetical protein
MFSLGNKGLRRFSKYGSEILMQDAGSRSHIPANRNDI